MPRPRHIPLESRPASPSPSPLTSTPVHHPDSLENENTKGLATQKTRHFDPIPTYLTHQETFSQAEQNNFNRFRGRATEQSSFEQPEHGHFDSLPNFASHQDGLSHFKQERKFPSFVEQVTPKPSFATRERNYLSRESNFPTTSSSFENNRGVVHSSFTPSPRDHFRDAATGTTSGQADSFHAPGHASPHPDLLLHDSEIVFASHVDYDDNLDPLYHSEVIYTPDQGDTTYDLADGSVYEDAEVRFEEDYEKEYEDEDEPGVSVEVFSIHRFLANAYLFCFTESHKNDYDSVENDRNDPEISGDIELSILKQRIKLSLR